jgi:hypothetical protein
MRRSQRNWYQSDKYAYGKALVHELAPESAKGPHDRYTSKVSSIALAAAKLPL